MTVGSTTPGSKAATILNPDSLSTQKIAPGKKRPHFYTVVIRKVQFDTSIAGNIVSI